MKRNLAEIKERKSLNSPIQVEEGKERQKSAESAKNKSCGY